MNRINRVTSILIQLQSKKIIPAKEIAQRFNISLRTVYRDIRTLEEAGIPIGSEAGKGYFLVEGFLLPPEKVLIDKDCRIKRDIVPTDIDYHVRKPSAREYDDCCNEFWNVTPYVIKGLCRKEILFAIDHLNQILRFELLRMMSWKVGIKTEFSLSVGKNYKYINKYIDEDLWNRLLSTYRMDSYENIWKSLFICHQLFREVSKEVAELLGFDYPEYGKNITRYTEDMYKKYVENDYF